MSDDTFQDDLARYNAAQDNLTKALDTLNEVMPSNAAHIAPLYDALRALDELRTFLVRDLGTAVSNLQHIEQGMVSLGEFTHNQREATNDLSATLAALVDLLLRSGVVDADALVQRKAELVSSAEKPDTSSGESDVN